MEDYIFGAFLTIALGFVLFMVGFLFVYENNYNHQPCDWFIQNNWSIGKTPSRCTENIFKSIEQ